jgi:hypothetical protein
MCARLQAIVSELSGFNANPGNHLFDQQSRQRLFKARVSSKHFLMEIIHNIFIMILTQWYAISISIITAFLFIYRIGLVTYAYFVNRFRLVTLKHFVYPIFIKRRYWTGVSRLHASLIGSYFVINGFCMGLGIRNSSDLIIRSGTMASINLMPLFLGGRTSILADFLGVSLHTYYLAHHWIGRMVIFQGIIHVALVLTSGKPWTFDSSQISGISVGSPKTILSG